MSSFSSYRCFILLLLGTLQVFGQFNGPQIGGWGGGPPGGGPPGGGPPRPPPGGGYGGGGGGSSGGPPGGYGKPPSLGSMNPLSPLAGLLPNLGGGNSQSSGGYAGPGANAGYAYDDPIPPMAQSEASYDIQKLPAHLPILAPNGVVEIYNRVVDDLIKRLKVDFKKRKIDPMEVSIRPTPAGPVRVPGYLQRRPFRRPGAALYRAAGGPGEPMPLRPLPQPLPQRGPQPQVKRGRAIPEEGEIVEAAEIAETDEKQNVRGAGKITKTPLDHFSETQESSNVTESSSPAVEAAVSANSTQKEEEEELADSEQSSEEFSFFRARSGEYLIGGADEDEEEEDDKNAMDATKQRDDDTVEENDDVEDEDDDEKVVKNSKKNVDALIYKNKNSKNHDKKKEVEGEGGKKEKEEKETKSKDKAEEKPSEEDDDDDDEEDDDIYPRDDIIGFDGPGREPGTFGDRPPGGGGYYPQQGPPSLPQKPNAVLTGLSKMRRSSDVSVSVDARSAIITARLLVGPINVLINESAEPLEKNVRGTIPELEAELLLMERHGVVFLQRFTLDRAYGQDVEISIPKPKNSEKKKKQQLAAGGPNDPNHPLYRGGYDRYKTKMAAHLSMEIVKILRSGNLRVNLMRTAQTSMNKLTLPIQKKRKAPSKSRKTPAKKRSNIKKKSNKKNNKNRRS